MFHTRHNEPIKTMTKIQIQNEIKEAQEFAEKQTLFLTKKIKTLNKEIKTNGVSKSTLFELKKKIKISNF